MAKRKKTRKHTTTRRRSRRMSGFNFDVKNDGMELAGLVVGSVAATTMQRLAQRFDPRLISAGQIVVGMYVRGMGGNFMKGVGYGAMSAGAIGLTHQIGLIRGVEDMVSGMFDGGEGQGYLDDGYQNGFRNDQYVSGLPNDNYVTEAGGNYNFMHM